MALQSREPGAGSMNRAGKRKAMTSYICHERIDAKLTIKSIGIYNQSLGANFCKDFFSSKLLHWSVRFLALELGFSPRMQKQFWKCSFFVIASYAILIEGACNRGNRESLWCQLCLLSLAALEVVVVKTSDGAYDDKVGTKKTIGVQWNIAYTRKCNNKKRVIYVGENLSSILHFYF